MASMMPPIILLREFQTESISDWVPAKFVHTYKRLEDLAHSIRSKDPSQWSVHFHFEDGVCEGKALPFLYNHGAYFDESCLKAGKLHLFAHFELIGGSLGVFPARTANTAPSIDINGNNLSRQHTQSSRLYTRDNAVLPPGTPEGPKLRRKPQPISLKRKRSKVQDLSSASESEGSAETQFLLSPSDKGVNTDDGDGTHSSAAVYVSVSEDVAEEPSSLPASATAAQHFIDFGLATSSNALPGQYGYKANWHQITKDYRSKVAHARLIKGDYGAPAPKPCDRCLSNGHICRIYHPDLNADRAAPGSCGECRLQSSACITGGQKQRMQKEKHPANSYITSSRKTIRAEAEEATTAKEYCPVVTCSRRTQSFSARANFLRHLRASHPEFDESRLSNRSRISIPTQERIVAESPSFARSGGTHGASTLVCPIPDCSASRSAEGYTRRDNFRRHVRTAHPESAHAKVLEALLENEPLVLPPAPTDQDFATDFAVAETTNAPPGAFGHREETLWSNSQPAVRIRLAHARLIHGKYGVMAPQPCPNCHKRGTTCLVYHPHLKGVNRALGRYCSHCRDRSVKCGLPPRPFDKYMYRDPTAQTIAQEGEDDEADIDRDNVSDGQDAEIKFEDDDEDMNFDDDFDSAEVSPRKVVPQLDGQDDYMSTQNLTRPYHADTQSGASSLSNSRSTSGAHSTPKENAYYHFAKYNQSET